MQRVERQFDPYDVPGFGVQLFALGRIQRPFGLFHQPVVALVLPPDRLCAVVALGVQIAAKKSSGSKRYVWPLNQRVELRPASGHRDRAPCREAPGSP